MPLSEPARIGRYEPTEVLRQDLFARVFRATDDTGNPVVVRLFSTQVIEAPGLEGGFAKQATAASTLEHPNLVRLLDHGVHEEQFYLVSEAVDGEPLDRLMVGRTFSLPEAFAIIKQVGRGLRQLHRSGLIHGRLTPASILVSPDFSQVWITDLGIATLTGETLLDPAGATGALRVSQIDHLPPERARDPGSLDQRGDVFSLGALFYELLIGRTPGHSVKLPSHVKTDLPTQLDPIILGCLTVDPKQRTASVDAFLSSLSRLQETERLALVAEVTGLGRGTKKLLRKERGKGSDAPKSRLPLVLGVAAAVIAAVAIGYFGLRGDSEPESQAQGGTSAAQTATTTAPDSSESSEPVPAPQASEAVVAAGSEGSDETETPTAEPPQSTPQPSPPAPRTEPQQQVAASTPDASGDATEEGDETASDEALSTPSEIETSLDVARDKYRNRLFDQAAADLSTLIDTYPSDPQTARAYLLLAQVHRAQDRDDDAMATYVETVSRFATTPEAAEALFEHAGLLLSKRRRRAEALPLLNRIVEEHATRPQAPRALLRRAELESQEKAKVADGELGATVPAALVTYRQLTRDYPSHPASEDGLWQLADLYEDEKRFDLAVGALSDLGERFAMTRYAAWFRAGELAERKLKDDALARDLYARVPEGSSDYRSAQNKLKRLGS